MKYNTIAKNLYDAYSDCENGSKKQRDLYYKDKRGSTLQDAVSAFVGAMGEHEYYNEFNPKELALLDGVFNDEALYYCGREGSPCLYIKPNGHVWLDKLTRIAKELAVDELSIGRNGLIRLWWD